MLASCGHHVCSYEVLTGQPPGWRARKLFLFCPRLLLFRLARGVLLPKGQLQELFNRLTQGQWLLWLTDSRQSTGRALPQKHHQNSTRRHPERETQRAKFWRERDKERNFGRSGGGGGSGVGWSGAGWSGESKPATTTTTPPEWGGGQTHFKDPKAGRSEGVPGLPGVVFGVHVLFFFFWFRQFGQNTKTQLVWPKSAMTDKKGAQCNMV